MCELIAWCQRRTGVCVCVLCERGVEGLCLCVCSRKTRRGGRARTKAARCIAAGCVTMRFRRASESGLHNTRHAGGGESESLMTRLWGAMCRGHPTPQKLAARGGWTRWRRRFLLPDCPAPAAGEEAESSCSFGLLSFADWTASGWTAASFLLLTRLVLPFPQTNIDRQSHAVSCGKRFQSRQSEMGVSSGSDALQQQHPPGAARAAG